MSQLAQMNNPLFLALDVDSDAEAIHLVQQTRAFVGGFKIGPRLAVRYGDTLLKQVARHGALFLDNKYFDIPNTMEAAVKLVRRVGGKIVGTAFLIDLAFLGGATRLDSPVYSVLKYN